MLQDDEKYDEPLISASRKKGISAVEGRGLVLVTVGLLIAIVLMSMPTLFHFWDFVTSAGSNKQVQTCSCKV